MALMGLLLGDCFRASAGRIALTDEDRVDWLPAKAGRGIVTGEIGSSIRAVLGEVTVDFETTTSFSSL